MSSLDLQLPSSPHLAILLAISVTLLFGYLHTSKRSTSLTPTTLSAPPPPPPLVDPTRLPSKLDRTNVRDTFLACRSLNGSVFRALEPNFATITYIGDPLTIKDIIDRPDSFDVSSLHTAAAPMWNISLPAGVWFAHTGGQATLQHSSHLLSGSRLASLQERFVAGVKKEFDRIETGDKGDLFRLLSECFFQATVEALFTPNFPRGEYEGFLRWDRELNQFCMACPSPAGVAARDRFYSLAAQQIDEHLSECSLQVREQLNDVKNKHGQSHADAVGVVLRTAWLGSTQSPLSGAWLLCILSQNPEKRQKIRDEVRELKERLGVGNVEEIASNPEMMKGENLPLLDSMVQELLRVYSAQNVPRMCLKDTVVRAMDGPGRVKRYQLRQGDILQLLFWNVHDAQLNPDWWPEDGEKGEKFRGTLETFDETRFGRHPGTAKLDGETVKTWTPFGYGARVCPGRYWAVAEIKAFVMLFLDRFDVETKGEMPRPDPMRWVGVLHAMDAMPATVTARS
ncbi:hypothetical protein PHBOTO_005002 [Pseudozyma hubeiensis]|nr:hypothetical protein PHBOTO_005002 [Pseudozyma hubeiensis]